MAKKKPEMGWDQPVVSDAQKFQDAVSREEIGAILQRVSIKAKRLHGNDLELLKNHLRKIFEY